MTFKDSTGKPVRLRALIDALRDNFIVSLDDTETARLPETLSSFDHAISETLLDLFDNPAPPSRQRALRSDAGKPRVSKPEPIVARPPRSRRSRGELPHVQLDSVEQDFARAIAQDIARETEQVTPAPDATKSAGA